MYTTDYQEYLHYNYSTIFFGFIDDTYVYVRECVGGGVSVEVMSTLRMGSSDFDVNAKRVDKIYTEIEERFEDEQIIGRGGVCQKGS